MSKYCIECGKELSDEAKFCSGCGKQQDELMGQKRKEQREEIQESTGPTALDLKAAISLLNEVEQKMENANRLEKPLVRELENKLKETEKLIEKAKNIDQNVKVENPITNEILGCNDILSLTHYLTGVMGHNFAIQHDKGQPSTQLVLKRAQGNFEESNKILPTSMAQYHIALAMDNQIHGKRRRGTTIVGVNGEKVFFNPIMPKKARKLVHDAYQRVIDLYPDSEWAVEARKNLSGMGI